MLRRHKIRSLKRVSGLRNNKKPKVYSKRARALVLRKNKIIVDLSGVKKTFLNANFGTLGLPNSRSISSPSSIGNTTDRLPKDHHPNEIGNIIFGEYKKGQGDTGWSTGRFHPSNPNGTAGAQYGWNIGNWGNTPSSSTGPLTGGISQFLPDDVTQNAVAGYAYTESSSPGYNSSSGRSHALRTPEIEIDSSLYTDCVLEFKSIFFQRNNVPRDWFIKLQFCTHKNFHTDPIYDMVVKWGVDHPYERIMHNFNARANSDGGDNKIFDSAGSSWTGDWVTCQVPLTTKATMYDQSGVPRLVNMDTRYYIRFNTMTYWPHQDWAIDSIRIYGYTK